MNNENFERELTRIANFYGVDSEAIQDLTMAEIQDLIDAKNERKKDDMRTLACLFYCNAMLIRSVMGSLLDKNVKIPELMEAFPFLWEEELKQKKAEKEAEKTADEKIYEAMLIKMMNLNKKTK